MVSKGQFVGLYRIFLAIKKECLCSIIIIMGICSGISTEWLFIHCFQIELELEMLIFVKGGKPENPEKNPRSRDENQKQTQPTCDAGSGNRTRATVVGGECSHHCAIPVPVQEKSSRCQAQPAFGGVRNGIFLVRIRYFH